MTQEIKLKNGRVISQKDQKRIASVLNLVTLPLAGCTAICNVKCSKDQLERINTWTKKEFILI